MPTPYTLPYQDAFGNGARPYLALHLMGPTGKEGDVVGLIDSGADNTCLPLGFAALMGYAASDLETRQGQQAGGTMTLYVAKKPSSAFVVGIPTMKFDIYPMFIDGAQSVLWGRADLFRTFAITIDETAQTLTLIAP